MHGVLAGNTDEVDYRRDTRTHLARPFDTSHPHAPSTRMCSLSLNGVESMAAQDLCLRSDYNRSISRRAVEQPPPDLSFAH